MDIQEIDKKLKNITEFSKFIEPLTKDELHLLNSLVVDRINLMSKAQSLISLSQFRRGDKVFWGSGNGDTAHGVIYKINQKTASIRADNGGLWKVSPGLLTKV